jgi:hypothetical protein
MLHTKEDIMKNLRIAVACAFCLTILAGSASAQMGLGMRPAMPAGVFNGTVGSGAQYESTASDGAKTTIEFAVVGKEAVNGKDAYWLEWTATAGQMGEMVMKVLITPGSSSGAASRTIMQMAGRPPMEMPTQSRTGSQPPPKMDIRGESEDIGKESVTTPAGTFVCEHYRAKDGSSDTWISTQVAPFGVVKAQGKNTTMVLTRQISDARDKIVGTPVPFSPQMMMQQMQQPNQ